MVVSVVGLGLIGGSILRGLADSGVFDEVVGFDSDPEAVRYFQEHGFTAHSSESVASASRTDLWVLATPPRAVRSVIDTIVPIRKSESVVTDVTSVKAPVTANAAAFGNHFVGGHPIAGKSVSHYSLSDPNLFVDRPWVLCHDTNPARDVRHRVESLVYALDAQPLWMSCDEHDEHVALLSHLPHILAAILLHQSIGLAHAGIGGGSWHDLTRVGGNYPELWRQILPANRQKLREHFAGLREKLDLVDAMLDDESGEQIVEYLLAADTVRQKLPPVT